MQKFQQIKFWNEFWNLLDMKANWLQLNIIVVMSEIN